MADKLPNGTLGVAEDLVVAVGDPDEALVVWWASDEILVRDATIGSCLPGAIFPDDVEIGMGYLRVGPGSQVSIIGEGVGGQFVFVMDFAILECWGRLQWHR